MWMLLKIQTQEGKWWEEGYVAPKQCECEVNNHELNSDDSVCITFGNLKLNTATIKLS
jgi:hypothetical protein